jgi:WD40 repeat protein
MSHIAKMIISFLFISTLLVGCMSQEEIPFNDATITETLFPLLPTVISPSQTLVITQSLATPTIDVKALQDEVIEGCVKLTNGDLDHQLDGILLLQSQGNYRLLNISNLSETPLIDQPGRIYAHHVSPDRKHLIVEVCDDGCVYILKNSTQIINTIPSQNYWILWQWLDNDRVIILSRIEPHNVVILSPFTGDVEILEVNLPNPYTIHQTEKESVIPISLNPSLNNVLFYKENLGGRLILWNINERREIVSLPYELDRSVGFDSWSPDGQRYVTASPDNRTTTVNALFEINVDGALSQLTHYDQEYEFSNVTSPVWSPDNQHIAFWLKLSTPTNSNPENLSQYLAIMDALSLETKILCQTFSTPYYSAFPIYWSSDGRQLIANTRTDKGVVEPIVIDIVRNTRTKINTGGSWVEGWMITP